MTCPSCDTHDAWLQIKALLDVPNDEGRKEGRKEIKIIPSCCFAKEINLPSCCCRPVWPTILYNGIRRDCDGVVLKTLGWKNIQTFQHPPQQFSINIIIHYKKIQNGNNLEHHTTSDVFISLCGPFIYFFSKTEHKGSVPMGITKYYYY